MKTLYLLRHAKASSKESNLPDVDRPLRKKGRLQADAMSDHLSSLLPPPQCVVSSPSLRTRQTLHYFLEVWPLEPKRLSFPSDLYLGESDRLLERVRELPDSVEVAMLVGHNPGISDLARRLVASTGKKGMNSMRTCGFLQVDFNCATWKKIKPGSGDVKLDLRPKDLKV